MPAGGNPLLAPTQQHGTIQSQRYDRGAARLTPEVLSDRVQPGGDDEADLNVEFQGTLVTMPNPTEAGERVKEIRRPWSATQRDVPADDPIAAVVQVVRETWNPLANLWLSDEGAYFTVLAQDYPRLEVSRPVDRFARPAPNDRRFQLNGAPALFDFEADHV